MKRPAPDMTGPKFPSPPAEPVLDMHDIQGIAVPGFLKPHQTLLCIRVPDGRQTLLHFKSFLHSMAARVSSAEVTLKDRRAHRRKVRGEPRGRTSSKPLVAMGLSAQGLRRVTPAAYEIPSVAFKSGLVARSALLGDPTDPGSEGNPRKWKVGGIGQELDGLVIVAGDHRDPVSTLAKEIEAQLTSSGIDVLSIEGDIREDDPGHEHFGFDDGVSQPGIRGRASAAEKDYITDRHVATSEQPATSLYGYPGQDLVWPGEFVLGYPSSSPDPLVPGPPALTQPAWTRNGSFLVFRRLRQDVGLFWKTMRDEAQRLAKLPGFDDLTYERLAALLVGRWPSGAPVNRTPTKDLRDLGKNPLASNHFRFDSDTPVLKLAHGHDRFPAAKADPVGITCPWAAHIRKVNTRDSPSDMGGRSSTYERRLLRVGVPFGRSLNDPFSDPATDPERGERGLLFLSIQTSIEEQFEFLQSRWINDDARPRMPGGNDLIVGQNAATGDGVRRCTLFGSGLQQGEVRADGQWVIPTGGGYFFVPSISVLREVLPSP